MTGLHTVGSALSFPSRVVWGTANALAGGPGGFGNLNPFDSTGGIELSQFLANQGLMAQNDPTKWEWGDVGRFGVDVLGDPTSYLGFGALTQSGKAASKAGRLTGTAAQQIGRGERALIGLQAPFSPKSLGLIGTGEGASRIAAGAARAGQAIADTRIPGTQISPVRWLTSRFDWRKLGMRTPETQAQAPRFAQERLNAHRGNAEFLQGIARGWQQAGMDTPQWQRSLGMARELGLAFEDDAGRLVTANDGPAFWDHLDPTGGLTQIDQYLKDVNARRQMKGISRTGELRDIVQHDADEDGVLEAVNNALLATNSRMKPEDAETLAGSLAEDWSESNITQGYLPRYMRPDVRKELDRGSMKGQGAMSVESPLSMQRQELLKGVRGGRSMIDAIVQDADADTMIRDLAARAESPEQAELQQQIAELLDEMDVAEADGADPDDLAEMASEIADLQSQVLDRENVLGQVEGLLQSKYGDYVVPLFNDPVERGAERSRLRVMSEWMVNHPELRQNGVYGADIIGDLWRYSDNAVTSENAFDFMADTVARYSAPGRAVDRPTVDDAKFVKVGSLLAKLGAHTNEAARYIGGLLNEGSSTVIERTVPKHIADDLTNLGEAIRPVKEAELGRNAFSKFMSAWKAGALSWPRRVIRDRMSGVVRNIEKGMFSGKAFMDAEHLYRGRELRGYERIPAVQGWIEEYGLQPTPEGATEAIRRKFGSYMASNPGIFTDLSDATDAGTAGGINRLLSAMPGAVPESFGQAAQRGVREAFSGLNRPFDIPGVKDIPEAKFGPVRAAQQLSEYTDYLNRAEAFLEQVRQGESDLPAIFNRIDSAQVNYDPRRSAPADRAMKQLFPFWRFMCVPPDHEILTSSGWKRVDQIAVGETVMSFNNDTGVLRWSPLRAINKYHYTGELVVIDRSTKRMSRTFKSTPNHRWPVLIDQREYVGEQPEEVREYTRADGTIVSGFRRKMRGAVATITKSRTMPAWRNSDELTTSTALQCRGDFQDNGVSVLSPRLAAILGWVVTDGYCRWVQRKETHTPYFEMMVYQSPKKHLAEIIALLGTPPRKPHPDTGVVCVGVARADVLEIAKVFQSKADLCKVVGGLSREAATAMRDAMFKAEGSWTRTNEFFHQDNDYNSEVMDAFQILCLMTGASANITKGGCCVKKTRSYSLGKNGPATTREEYDGEVWCPTTDDETWVMRHDGMVVITGNSRQMPYTLAEVTMNPGGRLAQGIKAVDRGMEADPSLPDAALSGTAIPLGASQDGTKAFLTGLGLMHETPVELLGQLGAGDLRSLGYGLAGQMNPLIQKPVEAVTGQSMFREGEKLSDLDPTIGRLLSNVGESVGLLPKGSQPVNVPYGSTLDMGLSLLPGLGPLATQARTAADPRRGTIEKAVQLATGARTLRQSPKAQRRVLRRRLEQLAEQEGGSLGTHLYARPGALERNPRLAEVVALSRALDRESRRESQGTARRRVLSGAGR